MPGDAYARKLARETPIPVSAQAGPSYEQRRTSHCHCIVCGQKNPASLGLRFERQPDGSVISTFRSNRFLQGYTGIMHGGIIASLLDAAMTHCLFHHDIEAVTGDLNVRFLHPVPCNSVLTISARLVEARGILYRMEADVHERSQKLAKASARFITPGQ